MSRKLCRFSGRWLGVFALLWLVCSTVRADEPPAAEGVKPLRRVQLRVLQTQTDAAARLVVQSQADAQPPAQPGVVQRRVVVQAQPRVVEHRVVVQGQPQVITERMVIRRAQVSGHWLGLECAPLGDALRSHLKAPQGQGLLVVNVVPDSPAEKKLRPHDVLLSAGEAPLRDIGDLVRAVEKSKDAELEFELIRGGETITVGVQPVERPVVLAGPWGRQGRFQIIRPGTILSGDNLRFFSGSTAAAFPGGLSVVIRQAGDDPATITVQRGDQKWEVTEEELDELPEDVRTHVQRLRENGALDREGAVHIYTTPRTKALPLPALPRIITPGFPRGDAERGMEEMKQRIERLERKFDQRFGPQQDVPDQDDPNSKPGKKPRTGE